MNFSTFFTTIWEKIWMELFPSASTKGREEDPTNTMMLQEVSKRLGSVGCKLKPQEGIPQLSIIAYNPLILAIYMLTSSPGHPYIYP